MTTFDIFADKKYWIGAFVALTSALILAFFVAFITSFVAALITGFRYLSELNTVQTNNNKALPSFEAKQGFICYSFRKAGAINSHDSASWVNSARIFGSYKAKPQGFCMAQGGLVIWEPAHDSNNAESFDQKSFVQDFQYALDHILGSQESAKLVAEINAGSLYVERRYFNPGCQHPSFQNISRVIVGNAPVSLNFNNQLARCTKTQPADNSDAVKPSHVDNKASNAIGKDAVPHPVFAIRAEPMLHSSFANVVWDDFCARISKGLSKATGNPMGFLHNTSDASQIPLNGASYQVFA